MEQEVEELKELVRRNIKVSEETNRIVHSLRRAERWHTGMRVVWWLLILGFFAASYAYFAPYITQIMELYRSIGSSEVFQNFNFMQ